MTTAVVATPQRMELAVVDQLAMEFVLMRPTVALNGVGAELPLITAVVLPPLLVVAATLKMVNRMVVALVAVD